MAIRSFARAVAFASLTITSLACAASQKNLTVTPEFTPTFILVVENDQGKMLGHAELTGVIGDFAITDVRADGSTVITKINNAAISIEVESSLNQILTAHGLPLVQLSQYLAEFHASCHIARVHIPARGSNFAGPAELACDDALVIGTTALTENPIWTQRGLLLVDRLYPDRLRFAGLPPAISERALAPPEKLTWEQAALFLKAIPKSTGTTVDLCPSGNGLFPEIQDNGTLLFAALNALKRFADESKTNSDLIVAHTGPGGFAVDKLEPEVQHHLLDLIREELARPNGQLSSEASAHSN
ncbi:MAG: hypothetical protein AAB490_01205 [Patescibacteria group bacterium]